MALDLKKLVVISGAPGVYKIVTSRRNGLVVEDFSMKKRRFFSSRKHQFTPLETMGIYTNDGGTAPLNEVFESMKEKIEEAPVPAAKGLKSDEAFDYLEKVLPNYDPNQVFLSDVQKLTKWFSYLHEHDQLLEATEEAEETAAENESQDAEDNA